MEEGRGLSQRKAGWEDETPGAPKKRFSAVARAEQHCNCTPVPRQHVGASATSRGCSQCALAGPARDDPRPWGCLGAQNIVAGKEVTASHLRPEDLMRRGPVRGSSWGCCPGLTRTSARFRGSRSGRRFAETRAQARGGHPLALQNSAHTPALGQAPRVSPSAIPTVTATLRHPE